MRNIFAISLVVALLLLSKFAFQAHAQENTSTSSPSISNPFTQNSQALRAAYLNSRSTATSAGTINKDNWSEFTKQKSQEIEKYRKQVQQEIEQKRKTLEEQRKACKEKYVNFSKQRMEQRKQLIDGCKPTFPTRDSIKEQMTSTGASMSAILATYKQERLSCYDKLKTFEKETQDLVKSIKESCSQTERQVLGLSTQVSQ